MSKNNLRVGGLIDALTSGEIKNALKEGPAVDVAEIVKSAVKFKVDPKTVLRKEIIEWARTLSDAKLIRLPFPVCLFEFDLDSVDALASHDTSCILSVGATDYPSSNLDANFHSAAFRRSRTTRIWGAMGDDDLTDDVVRILLMTIAACIAFMDLKEARVNDVWASDKVNKARRLSGRKPFYSYKILTITPEWREAIRTGTKRLIERRAHWRRGHLRHLPDRIVPVRPALVRGEGFVEKDYQL